MVITDNVRVGTVKGLGGGLPTSGAAFVPAGLTLGLGDPNDIVTCQTGSDIFYDTLNKKLYRGMQIGGSEWVNVGSTT